MNADIETAKRVYAYVRQYRDTHRQLPSPRETFAVLGVTKRQYLAALHWLHGYGFVQRNTVRDAWSHAAIATVACACGTEITPDNARFVQSRGACYLRRECAACYNAKEARRMKVWRMRRALRRQNRQQQKGASA